MSFSLLQTKALYDVAGSWKWNHPLGPFTLGVALTLPLTRAAALKGKRPAIDRPFIASRGPRACSAITRIFCYTRHCVASRFYPARGVKSLGGITHRP